MAAAWHGGVEGTDPFVNSSTLFDAISRAMDYWFMNDFTVLGCLDSGGLAACPCGTPGFWNTNWFANVSHDALHRLGATLSRNPTPDAYRYPTLLL